jgi:hypothetical protein
MYYTFVDETETCGTTWRKIYSMLFNNDGSVDVLIRYGNNSENTERHATQHDFAIAHPVQAANVMEWMRKNGRDIKEIQFPEKSDLVPITKRCQKCGKAKPILEFPLSDLSRDGSHKECCDCRIKECKTKKMYCSANHQPAGNNFGESYLRFERCKDCPVGEP